MTPFLFLKSLEPGERWITLHPHGRDEKGQPVLIKPAGDGSYHVIGGAGGALNALKLVGVRSEESYKKEAAQRAQGRKEEAKRQAQSDRKAGLTESKAAIAEGLRATLGDERVKFVSKIAEAMGWKDDDLRFPEEKYQDVSPSARAKAADEHANALLKVAGQAVEFQRQRMVTDAETRMESGLGEIPMTSSRPDRLSVQDLDPIAPQTSGFGFATGYTKRAEAKGSTQEDISVEAEKIDPEEADKRKAREEAKAKTRSIEAELTGLHDVMPQVNPNVMVEAKRALDILKAAKQFAMVKSDVRAKVKKLKKDETIEPKAYLVETANRPVDQDVIADVENDLRTLRTRSFLDMAGPAEKLTRHVGIGAFNSINALALAAGGTAMIDRSVVDVLGVAGAAEVLARRLKHDLTEPEVGEIAQAMQAFHIDRYMEITQESMNEAKEMHEAAAEIALGEAEDTTDLAVMQELNAKRQDYVDKAQEILGTSLGEMEANAALVLALKQAPKQTIQVSLGKTDIRHAITQMRALGLEEGEYELEKAGASTMLTVRAPGIDKLAKPVSREDLQTVRESLAIINGDRDEDGWLPQGVSTRPELAMNAQQGVAPRLAKPFDTMTQDVKRAVADYIGGRAADGEAPADIMAGLLSEDIMRATDRTAFLAAVNEIAPLYDAQGKMIRVEKHAAAFDRLADDFVERAYGADRTPINRQNFKVNPASMEALHQALASNPDAVAAFKPVGDMTPQDQAAMRETFMREYGRTDPEAEKRRMAVEKLDSQEPAKESQGLFGMDANPDWSAWKQERDQAAELANAAAMTWGKYVGTMGSPQAAYAAMQDVVKSTAIKTFVDHYNTNQKTPLIIGRQVIANDLKHLDALDPEARARRAEQQAKLIDSLRTRVAGKYASGSVKEKEAAAREAEEAVSQSQMGLFATEAPKARKLALGERYTLGHAAERTIAGMMSVVGANFKPGQDPVKTFRPTMDGKYVARQRAVKLIKHNKRMMLGLGVGSGKTAIMLGSFTDLKTSGGVKKGLFLVPSIVQGQFHGEALKMLDPGKFRWHADPSGDREARLRAYRDPENDFTVVTHQGFRDDFDHLAEQRDGMTSSKFDALPAAERKAYAANLMKQEGWNTDFLAVDEGHNLLNRAGKKNSHLANVVDAISGNTPYYVNATADPVKNDATEAADVLAKLEPERYTDRDAFIRRYGVNTPSAKAELQREMARHFYTGAIDPGVQAHRKTVSVQINPESGQHDDIKAIEDAASAVRAARSQGKTDVAAMKFLSPAAFEGVPEPLQEDVAKRLQTGLAMIRATAIQHAVNDGAKTEALAKIAGERKGKPGVVFIHRLDRVKQAAARLKKDGHRVVTLTGGDSSAEKDRKKADYQAGKYDIMVASDAGAVGANLQHGSWLAQFDIPQTAMLHAQRQGRIYRVGQQQDVELIDIVADHPSEKRARARLEKKYALREVMTSPLEGLDEQGLAGYLSQARAHTLDAERPGFVQAPADEPRPEGKGQLEMAA